MTVAFVSLLDLIGGRCWRLAGGELDGAYDLWPGGHQDRRDVAEKRGLRASRGEGEADTGGGFDDAGAKLQ